MYRALFFSIVIFYCANTTAFHVTDWKFSEGNYTLNWVAKWVAAWKRLKVSALEKLVFSWFCWKYKQVNSHPKSYHRLWWYHHDHQRQRAAQQKLQTQTCPDWILNETSIFGRFKPISNSTVLRTFAVVTRRPVELESHWNSRIMQKVVWFQFEKSFFVLKHFERQR